MMDLIELILGALVFAAVMGGISYYRRKEDFSWLGVLIATAVFLVVSVVVTNVL